MLTNSLINLPAFWFPAHHMHSNRINLFLQLSAFLSDIGLNIREAHVFSTMDGYSLDVFVVDGWATEVIFRPIVSFAGLPKGSLEYDMVISRYVYYF